MASSMMLKDKVGSKLKNKVKVVWKTKVPANYIRNKRRDRSSVQEQHIVSGLVIWHIWLNNFMNENMKFKSFKQKHQCSKDTPNTAGREGVNGRVKSQTVTLIFKWIEIFDNASSSITSDDPLSS